MYRSVLTNAGFIGWANEHVVVLIAHNELGHEPERIEGATGDAERCPLYPGMTCRDHLNAAVDIDAARDEDLVQVPFIELCPNTWLVRPDGRVDRVEEKDQFVPKAIRKQVEAVQEELGKALDKKTGDAVRERMEAGDAALDEGSWKDALSAWAEALARAKEPPPSLRRLVEARLAALDEEAALEAEDLLDSATPTPEQRAQAAALLAALDVQVLGRRVGTHAALEAWLKAHPER